MRNTIAFIVFHSLLIPAFLLFAEEAPQKKSPYLIGINFGVSAATPSQSVTAFPLGYSFFKYGPTHTTSYPLDFGIFIGKSLSLSDKNTLQIALDYDFISKINIRGALEQGITPPYYPFQYHYSIKSAQVLFEMKLLHQLNSLFFPYFTAGLGVGFSKAENYGTDVPPYLTLTPLYANKSTTSFRYRLGLGVDIVLLHSLTAGIGYRFSDLGSVNLGQGQLRHSIVSNSPHQKHLYLNTVLFQLTYLF